MATVEKGVLKQPSFQTIKKFQVLCFNQLKDIDDKEYLWEKMDPLEKEEMERYNIFLKAYDRTGDSRLTMEEFLWIILP